MNDHGSERGEQAPTMSGNDILFARQGGIALITLNRPKALNALTLDMIKALDERLTAWERDEEVRAVVIEGAGERAFCAGGDVRALYEAGTGGDPAVAREFYWHEYRQNRHIFRYAKPYVALIDGIVMGGGVGVSVHGSHRVATEHTLFAMPETGIGMFPDVGGGYFLPRLPGEIGMYLALTGARLKAADCLYAEVATHYVPARRLAEVKAALAEADLSGGRPAVDRVLAEFHEDPGPAPLAEHREAIDRCFSGDSVEAILAALAAEGSAWAEDVRRTILQKSPFATKLAFRELREGAALSFEDDMRMEYRLCRNTMAGHDFYEGVRAVIIDKDNAPEWRPDSLDKVSEEEVARYFAPLSEDELDFD